MPYLVCGVHGAYGVCEVSGVCDVCLVRVLCVVCHGAACAMYDVHCVKGCHVPCAQ